MTSSVATYVPSDSYSTLFWEKEALRGRIELDVPDTFPKHIDSPLAWTGSEIETKESEWKLDLTAEEVAIIDDALAKFEDLCVASHLDLSKLSISTFELPDALSLRLRKLSDQIYKGAGFQIIRGLDPSKYTPKQSLIVYAGVSAHVCPQRGFVDVKSEGVVAHVVNVQAGGRGPLTTAPAFTNVPLSFHTDNCEVMAFFYMEPAASGGETILSSLWQTYNELADKRPDVLQTLTQPWVFDSFKSYDFQPPRHVQPLQKLESHNVPILFRFSRYGILGWQRRRNPDLPAPTEAQIEAADAIQFIAMKNAFKVPTRKGDILFVNDMALVHAREGFDDGRDTMKRHLIKMHFRDPDQGWDIPASLENEWKMVYSPNQPDGTRTERWNIFHEPGLEENSNVNG
ncbi:hypothetical protein O1611_g2987 [Lasiodiplodia mahajangana]|uniref:Uncharacterized protein n=1 Tax=Lasiodiplodia mahajangana TaxID=1108764 RepID=A0ACC2JT12_9PEZI|nr:hypothetical protein O1611_g2987 [Lasiodiplodia mahajangana]